MKIIAFLTAYKAMSQFGRDYAPTLRTEYSFEIPISDTNVLLAAFLTDGICAKLLTRTRKRRFDLFFCPRILNEFKRIISKKFKAGREETAAAVAILHEAVQTMVKPVTADEKRSEGHPVFRAAWDRKTKISRPADRCQ